MMSLGTVEVENISFSYPDNREVLKQIKFDVAVRERVALVGPNGSGKTTLFLLISGILKPAQGCIRISGSEVRHNRFDPEIAYLFQSPDDQLFSPSVFDDVAFGPLNMGLSHASVHDRVDAALARVDCSRHAAQSPHHLSGGEKRMVALATLLAMQPSIMMLDEPTSNLDMKNRRRVIETLSILDKTMLIASHDLEFLLETCTRALIFDHGKIMKDGPIAELFSDEDLMRAHHLEKPHSLHPHTHRKEVSGIPADH
ncbi:MAG: energy-coupling factor ABC transporter ATP-binding protein [Planctomycetota bacterium]